MVVIVHLHTVLQRRAAGGTLRRLEMTLPTGSTLGDLLHTLDIAPKDDAVLLVVNGRQAPATQVLGDGDEVNLIPALSGGAPTSDDQWHPARPT